MPQSATAIIIDDNEDITKLLSDILKVLGLDVIGIGHNGNDAINLFKELNPDIIVMDVIMPEVNGHEALLEIRKKSTEAKIIMMTSLASTELELRLKDDGADAFIFKPFSIQKMKEVTEKIQTDLILQAQ